MTYAITGSTGALGTLVVQHLLKAKVSPSSIVALARSEAKAQALKDQGVTVRVADYDRPETLTAALAGVDRLLLISASEIGRRTPQHAQVIKAAAQAGVKLIAYTSISHADTSINPLAPEHRETEKLLKDSGVPHVLLRNNWYFENYAGDLKAAAGSGVIAAAAGKGKVGSALRTEYAEAAARVLTGEGHAGRVYELGGTPWSYDELAAAVSTAVGKPVTYKTISFEEKKAFLVSVGLPDPVAGLFAEVDRSISQGSLDAPDRDLEKLLGRKPAPLAEAVKTILG